MIVVWHDNPQAAGLFYRSLYVGNDFNFHFLPGTSQYRICITIKFCACTDSFAVGACAKFCGDQSHYIQIIINISEVVYALDSIMRMSTTFSEACLSSQVSRSWGSLEEVCGIVSFHIMFHFPNVCGILRHKYDHTYCMPQAWLNWKYLEALLPLIIEILFLIDMFIIKLKKQTFF